jgi:FdhE protein
MHRTDPGVRSADDARARLAEARRSHHAWAAWLNLQELVFDAIEDAAWGAHEPELSASRSDGAPLLDGARLSVDPRTARRWVRRLIRAAAEGDEPERASLARLRSRRLDPLALLEAAVRHDPDPIATLAADAGVASAALSAVAQLAAIPLLHACRARLARLLPQWRQGYCPVCGEWPVLAELRGLDRSRRLRCGRCAADWQISVLRCPYCFESSHDRLGSFLLEDEQRRRIDVCRSCLGYVKTLTTLQATPDRLLPLEDLETLDLDFAARARGFMRPDPLRDRARITLVRSNAVPASTRPGTSP